MTDPVEFNLRRYEGINYKNFKYLNTSFRKTIIFLKHTQGYAILLI